ncbi:MAG: substrate binding domain-containing protein [Halopseudomonas sp.]
MIDEGVDLAVRVGVLPDSGLIARQIGQLNIYIVASPDYIARYGEPQTPKDLAAHRCILDSSISQTGRWRYQAETGVRHISVSGSVEVSNGELVADFAADGLGIACLPDFIVADQLKSGKLVRVLKQYETAPVPISLVYPGNRIIKPAQRALIELFVESASFSYS